MDDSLELQLGQEVLGLIPDEITLVEENCGTVYVETKSGKVYAISVMECEE